MDIPLEILYSPYRELARPVLRYVDELDAQRDNDIVTIVIPEFVVGSWWGQLLHNQSALFLKGRSALPQEHRGHVGAVSRRGNAPVPWQQGRAAQRLGTSGGVWLDCLAS